MQALFHRQDIHPPQTLFEKRSMVFKLFALELATLHQYMPLRPFLKRRAGHPPHPPVPNRMPDQILLFEVPGFWEIFVAVKVFYRCPYFRNN